MRIKGIKTLSVIFAVIMLLGSFTALASERDVVATSTSGDVVWTFYSDGELNVTGSGSIFGVSGTVTKYYSQIKKITIGEHIKCYESFNFDGNYTGFLNLESIVVEEGNTSFSTDENGVLFDVMKTKLYLCPAKTSFTEYYIPDSVETICTIAFGASQTLKTITGGKNLKTIDPKAFYCSTSITEINLLSDKLENIKNYAFYKCTALEKVTVSGGTPIIENRAFEYCSSLENVEF
ncbi:MAG: leucine-rich repeat domain-containing protein, partial [Clostridia bacterium]|nr:leucine-rich repeat domain-containing protein [Clostridia bacterium]